MYNEAAFAEAEAVREPDKEPRKVVNEPGRSRQQDDRLDELDGLDEDGRRDQDEGQESKLVPVPSEHRSEGLDRRAEFRFRRRAAVMIKDLLLEYGFESPTAD